MHELPVTQGILDTAIQAAQANGGRKITLIDIVIGDLSSIVDDSVQFYFDILSAGTLAEGARLRLTRISATATCKECGHTFAVTPPLSAHCAQCGGGHLSVSGGRECYVDSIEVEDESSSDAAHTERQRSVGG